jgi:hypothetical protein
VCDLASATQARPDLDAAIGGAMGSIDQSLGFVDEGDVGVNGVLAVSLKGGQHQQPDLVGGALEAFEAAYALPCNTTTRRNNLSDAMGAAFGELF